VYGITFNGKHSYNDYGLLVKSVNRPIAEPKIIATDVDAVDGSFDFSEVNPDGRTKYKDKVITVTFMQIESIANAQTRAREISRWLNCGETQLIFDDEPGLFYLAKMNNKIDLETQVVALREFSVQFKCRPYAYSIIQSNQQIQFGQGLQLGYGYRFDMTPTVYSITTDYEILNIYNPGDYVKPVIIITGTADEIELSCNGKTLSFNSALGSGETLTLDCSKYQSTVSNLNANNAISGNYFEFKNGNNTLYVSGTNLDINIQIVFRYTYL
jgi:predicted phage tail component-like protein